MSEIDVEYVTETVGPPERLQTFTGAQKVADFDWEGYYRFCTAFDEWQASHPGNGASAAEIAEWVRRAP
jgi:hypothetical protein